MSLPDVEARRAEIEALRRRIAELEGAQVEHKRTEEALRASERKAAALLEAASDGIVIIDAEGRIVLVNAHTETLFGYPRAELIGHPLEMLVPERLREAHVRHRSGYRDDPHPRSMGRGLPLTGRRRDGTEFPVEIRLSVSATEEGALFMAFVTDLTERRRAEAALRQSERRAQALLEAASEGVVVVDGAGRLVSVNRKTEQLFGYARSELLGQPLEILLPERLRGVHADHRHRYFAEPRVRSMGRGLDLVGRRKDGSEFPVEISLSFVTTDEGLHALGFVTDISERLALERATRRAERLSALGRLAAGVAHEVNNPMGIISSRLELMLLEAEEQRLPPSVVDDLQVLHRHALRVVRIAQSLLSFSRDAPAERAPVDLNGVVEDALALMHSEALRTGTRLRTELDPALPAVLGHANALVQVVLNLLANATQAIGGGGEIRLTTLRDGDQVRLEVADTGPGIPPELLATIFDPFYTTKESGTGLGLSVSYGIVHDHNGTLEVHSQRGQGATFTIKVPALGR